MDLGTSLRQARERAGVSLPDLAARTRIPLKSLQAIEENNFAAVPPGIFARSFIRTYAREVGADPAAAVAEYRSITEPVPEPDPERKQESAVDDDLRSSSFDPDLLTSRPDWGYALIAAALIIGVIAANRNTPTDAAAPPAAKAVAALTLPVEPARTVATTGTGVRLEMRAEGLCWVRATADGQTVVARLLQRGETQIINAQSEVVLRVGDPSALSYWINGKPGRSLGDAEIPVTVRVAANGELSPAS